MQNPYDQLRARAQNLLSTGLTNGLSLINSVTSNFVGTDYHSSDDEENDAVADTDEFIENGGRGVLVFQTTSQKSGKRKMLHLDLRKSQFISYHDGIKHVHACSDVVNVYKVSELQLNVELRGNRSKHIVFQREGLADRFHMYLEYINEQGRAIRRAFNVIDADRSGRIERGELQRALEKVDLQADEETLLRMLEFGKQGHTCIDFTSFFHLFMDSFVSNLRDCLQDWLAQATSEESESMTSQRMAQIVRLLPGEIISFLPPEKVHWCVSGGKTCASQVIFPGRICATNYRIVFLSSRKKSAISTALQASVHSRYDVPAFFQIMSVPLGSVYRVFSAAPRSSIYVQSKDYRTLRVTLSGVENNRGNVAAYLQMLQSLAFPNVLPANPRDYTEPAQSALQPQSGSSRSGSVSTASARPSTVQFLQDAADHQDALRRTFFAYSFALDWVSRGEDISLGWNHADVVKEYERQGLVGSAAWRVVENKDYSLSRGYPRYLAVPRQLTPDQVRSAAAFRSQGRMPAITYRHRASEAVLVRAAQPLVGLTQKHCFEDRLLLELYRTHGWGGGNGHAGDAPSRRLYILDARGKLAATLNMAAGKGTEDVSQYTRTELVFGNIENIHAMRSSAAAFADALAFRGLAPAPSAHTFSTTSSSAAAGGGVSLAPGLQLHPHDSLLDQLRSPDSAALGFWAKVEDSGWLRHKRMLLQAAVFAAEKIHVDGCSVLVHCSDGWDRTAQICALAQVLLDPHFRTLDGLCALVEKDWCAFGHKFHERLGHGSDEKQAADERSPVFLQFLECLAALVQQFPRCFEYGEDALVFLADHSTSALFGTFLGNTDEQRRATAGGFSCLDQTVSVWAYLTRRRAHFCAHVCEPYAGVLWPRLSMADMGIWRRFWSRWDVAAHPLESFLSGLAPWQDDWGEQMFLEALPSAVRPVPAVPRPSASDYAFESVDGAACTPTVRAVAREEHVTQDPLHDDADDTDAW